VTQFCQCVAGESGGCGQLNDAYFTCAVNECGPYCF
jgi:hypothetical protein